MNNYLKMSSYVSGLRLLRDFVIVFLKFLKHGGNAPKDYFCTDNPMKYDREFLDAYAKKDRKIFGAGLFKEEVYTIYTSIKATRNLEGDIAEVGVARGGSAKVICEIKGDKGLYLFDTFGGMPDELINPEIDRWRKGTYTEISLDQVKENLKDYSKVYYLKGLFPDSAYQDTTYFVKDKRFCFVHLDVDLYQSTLDALKFFWPRMTQGGRIVSHNYNLSAEGGGDTPGVKAAFLEYFKGGGGEKKSSKLLKRRVW